jgi:hypothetical protein
MNSILTAHKSPSLNVPGDAPLTPIIGALRLPKACPKGQFIKTIQISDLRLEQRRRDPVAPIRLGIFTRRVGKIVQNAKLQSLSAAAQSSFDGERRYDPPVGDAC